VSFLLDTNVVSEWTRPNPNPGVIEWLAQVDEDRVFISVITLAELRHGVDRLAPGKRRILLDEWLREELLLRFEGRILSIDEAVADACGAAVAHRDTDME
jgi:predicted nucleic acid-binding protein